LIGAGELFTDSLANLLRRFVVDSDCDDRGRRAGVFDRAD
jgi:hypothetical protein